MTRSVSHPTLLVVEDDEDTRVALVRALRARGYRVEEAADARAAIVRWQTRRPDLVLLDLGLPDMEGIRVIRMIRREASTPIIVLSARDQEITKVEALDQGADDYVTKPAGMAELEARLRAALRRATGPAADVQGRLVAGSLTLDPNQHVVSLEGRGIDLTPREFEILRVLLSNQGRVVTRSRLLRAVWGQDYAGEDHYLHVFVSRVRTKLAKADPTGELRDLIVTVPGVGYRIGE